MSTEQEPEQTPSLFTKAVNAHHATLLADREKLLVELQLLDRGVVPAGVEYTFSVSEKLAKLSEIDSQMDTVKRYFSHDRQTENKDP